MQPMKNNSPLISVIVPVYNAEKYLSRCIDSILAQTFVNFELLLINDGSKDNSGKICDEYAAQDNRIIVFHTENNGVSSARNIGLDNAKGEWICFCDSDDWFYSNDTFNINFNTLCSIDIIEIPYSRNNIFIKPTEHSIEGVQNVKKYYANNFHNEVWGRLYKKRLLKNTRFMTSLKIGEDVIFFLSLFKNINNIHISAHGGYRYFRNMDSVMVKTDFDIEKLQIEKYLTIIDELKISKEDIIGFYFNISKYIWSIRKNFHVNNINFITQFTWLKIYRSNLTIKNKLIFIILYYKFLLYYTK